MEHLSKDQMAALFNVARNHSERDYLMILLGYKHGLRASEVCSLRVRQFDVTATDVYLTVHRLKKSLKTVQPLYGEAKEAVLNWIRGKRPDEYLFPGKKSGKHLTRVMFFLLFRRHCNATGIIPAHLAHAHVLKHSIAMHVIQKAGIENTRRFLGHRSLQSTAHYLKADDMTASAAVAAAMGA
jgi:type 1 fimbriae regulatory protein FimB